VGRRGGEGKAKKGKEERALEDTLGREGKAKKGKEERALEDTFGRR
jgi:hypothetical protein